MLVSLCNFINGVPLRAVRVSREKGHSRGKAMIIGQVEWVLPLEMSGQIEWVLSSRNQWAGKIGTYLCLYDDLAWSNCICKLSS